MKGRRIAIKKKSYLTCSVVFLIIYVFTVIWFTVLKRSVVYQDAQNDLLWSYKRWLAGDIALGKEIMANIAMFVPYGFLIASVQPPSDYISESGWGRAVVIILTAAVFSLTIEALQLFLMRGLFEWDDLVSNTCGAIIGWGAFGFLKKLLVDEHFSIVITAIGAVFVLGCFVVYICGQKISEEEVDSSSRAYCFQIDEASVDGDVLTLIGFAFRYEHAVKPMSLALRSTQTGRITKLTTTYGIERPDVNNYFLCEYDYSRTGFSARGSVDPFEEYEILVQWPWSVPLSTGVFITGDSVQYFASSSIQVPDIDENDVDLQAILENGTLRVFRLDYHCWVYQMHNELYWIVDSAFDFEEDGTTYIQYQMWTTQIENLPEKRLAQNCFWDNIGGYFENHEMIGSYGSYRVMKRDLPTAYSVSTIVTGYYKNGAWIWKNYFRPIYEFD